ncbi:MAG: potassium-transporting ATPase subunit KdpA, partial [Candidatus Promineofilum sp.]|nr:potassium-transporting ATPase subunit KdpA [Promineifilum sp.]
TLGLALWLGRFGVIIPVMAIAGSMVGKSVAPPSPGTFPTDQPLFAGMLVGVVVIVGALTFFPALSLGPIVEHFLMAAGRGF